MHLGLDSAFHQYSAGDVMIKQKSIWAGPRSSDGQPSQVPQTYWHRFEKCKSMVAIIKKSFICPNGNMIGHAMQSLDLTCPGIWQQYLGTKLQLRQSCSWKITRRITEMVTGLSHAHYPDRLKYLNLPSPAYRTYIALITIFKLVTGRLEVWCQSTEDWERATFNLGTFHETYKSQGYGACLLIRETNVWNSLPERVGAFCDILTNRKHPHLSPLINYVA